MRRLLPTPKKSSILMCLFHPPTAYFLRRTACRRRRRRRRRRQGRRKTRKLLPTDRFDARRRIRSLPSFFTLPTPHGKTGKTTLEQPISVARIIKRSDARMGRSFIALWKEKELEIAEHAAGKGCRRQRQREGELRAGGCAPGDQDSVWTGRPSSPHTSQNTKARAE
jgi:hypothetical protein